MTVDPCDDRLDDFAPLYNTLHPQSAVVHPDYDLDDAEVVCVRPHPSIALVTRPRPRGAAPCTASSGIGF